MMMYIRKCPENKDSLRAVQEVAAEINLLSFRAISTTGIYWLLKKGHTRD